MKAMFASLVSKIEFKGTFAKATSEGHKAGVGNFKTGPFCSFSTGWLSGADFMHE